MYIYIYIYIYICMYICVCLDTQICTYIHAYIHTYRHTYVHTCANTPHTHTHTHTYHRKRLHPLHQYQTLSCRVTRVSSTTYTHSHATKRPHTYKARYPYIIIWGVLIWGKTHLIVMKIELMVLICARKTAWPHWRTLVQGVCVCVHACMYSCMHVFMHVCACVYC